MPIIRNPILRGFNPDPSILRVGGDYYIATSTFEWFPGIRLHHSSDLVNWRTIGHALRDPEVLDLRGIPDSGGIWAPSLSYVDGEFWLAYLVVRTMDGDDKDLTNYLITAPTIEGPWSESIPLGSRGFDFSSFHDDDGTHWIVGVQWDQRPEHLSFAGLVIEQYDPERRTVSGEPTTLLRTGSLIEGPNLYHVGDWYYLLIAQGGTGWNHGVAMARSRELLGPYETDPQTSVLTSREDPNAPPQKAGHGELVQSPSGEWLLVHLAARPVTVDGARFCITGRETSLQRVNWDADGWLRLTAGGVQARTSVEIGDLRSAATLVPVVPERDDFDAPELDSHRFSTLREPVGIDLISRPGWLRIPGGRSPASVFGQAMIAQRIEENTVTAVTVVDAEPISSRQAAGLVAWYDRQQWIWAQVTWDAENGRHLRLVERDLNTTTRSPAYPLPGGAVELSFILADGRLQFALNGTAVGFEYDAWKLSDDYAGRLRFTGAFAGIRVDDLDSVGWHADFDSFALRQ